MGSCAILVSVALPAGYLLKLGLLKQDLHQGRTKFLPVLQNQGMPRNDTVIQEAVRKLLKKANQDGDVEKHTSLNRRDGGC